VLSKPLCKRCLMAALGREYDAYEWDLMMGLDWGYRRTVVCPGSVVRAVPPGADMTTDRIVSVRAAPPKWCPYALEHIMEARGHAE